METKVNKTEIQEKVTAFLLEKGLDIVNKDFERPWGGFFVLSENQTEKFIKTFFPHLSLENFAGFEKLSPKILVVEAGSRLSWQYHHRRAEIWKLIAGKAGVAVSDTDIENPPKELQIGQVINLKCGERHRLVGGTEGYGLVAEIWQHTDPQNHSDENDIVRVQDDFGR